MKKPALRFKGFDGEWDNVPFDKGMSFLSNNTLSRADLNNVAGDVQNVHYGDVLIKFGEVLDLTKEELPFINAGFDFSKLSSSILTDGDIVIADTAEDETAGKCTEIRNVENKKVLAGLHTMPCRPNAKYASGYLGYYMNSPAYHNQLLKYMQGTKVISISKSALGNTVLACPSDVTEQKAIGSFFTELDSLIEGKRVKLDKLKKLKLAYLGKMFPKKGVRVPEVRFKGFSGDWEEKTLGSIAEIVGGGTPSTSNPDYWNGSIDWFSPTEIGESPYAECSRKKLTQKGFDNCSANMLPALKTILFTSRAGIGDAAILKVDACTNQGFQSIVLKDGIDTYFIYSMTPQIKDFALIHASGSTFLEISGKVLASMPILHPSLPEQQKIGAFFQNLDNLIGLQQQELDKLTNIKSACLSKMFA